MRLRTLIERLEAFTKTGVPLRVIQGGVGASKPFSAKAAAPVGHADLGVSIAGVKFGETVERNGMRMELRSRNSLRVTDLENAGKRGKQVNQFSIYGFDDLTPENAKKAEKFLKAILDSTQYSIALNFGKRLSDEVGVGFDKWSERGVDVVPAAGKMGAKIKIETPTFRLEASSTDFIVRERPRSGPTGDDTENVIPPSYGKKKGAVVSFYNWVHANRSDIEGMTYRELRRAMSDAGLKYHTYSTMD